jgi:drug/metabolite transporter (DMT)-like permease
VFALALLACIWGFNWIPSKLAIAESSALVFAALRNFPAFFILLLVAVATRRPVRPKALGLTAAMGVLQVGGFAGLTSAALVAGGAGHIAMLGNTWQFWLLFVAWLFLGERVAIPQWVSAAIGLVGIVLIIEPWHLSGVLSSLLALAGAVCFAAGAVVAKVLRRREQVDLLSLTAWQGLLGSVPLVVLAFLFPGDGIQWSVTFIWSLAFTVVIGTSVGFLLWMYVLSALPAGVAGIGTIGSPVVGVLTSWSLLGEELSAAEITGMVLVVAALTVLAFSGLRVARRNASNRLPKKDVAL